MKILALGVGILLLLVLVLPAAATDPVDPATVTVDLLPGATADVDKTVTVPEYPPVLDLLLLEDETGSFGDDIGNMKGGLAEAIWDGIAIEVADFQGGVAGFRDFAQDGWGLQTDWVYRRTSDLSPVKANWLAGVGLLSAPLGAGADAPEAQLAALKSAADGHAWDSNGDGDFIDLIDTPSGMNPAWRTGATHVVMLVTDAPYHVNNDPPTPPGWPGPTYTETTEELTNAGIHVIILATEGADTYYTDLAEDTGGSVNLIEDGSANIVQATLAALEEIKTDVWAVIDSDTEIEITMEPMVQYGVSGSDVLDFTETITADSCAPAGEYSGTVEFYSNTYPEEGTLVGTQEVSVTVLPIPVYVDIKPGSCPNAFNPKQKGVTPVAIAGTADFDVTTIDPASVRLNGISPLRWSYEDVTTPYTGTDRCGCWEEGADGYMDLVLHFDSQTFAGTLTGYTVKGDPVQVVVTGSNECGASIQGFDCVRVVQ